MTQDEIIEMAQKCGLVGMRPHLDGIYIESLLAFAKLVAEAEREACAKVAEDMDAMTLALLNVTRQPIAIAAAIRARGQA